ncbi:MAG: flagellar hook-length control protein FliK [Pseudomonadota bacterium]
MTEAAKLLGGTQVAPARGAGPNQRQAGGHASEAAGFAALLMAVEQIAALRAQGALQVGEQGQLLPQPGTQTASPELQALLAQLDPETLQTVQTQIANRAGGANPFANTLQPGTPKTGDRPQPLPQNPQPASNVPTSAVVGAQRSADQLAHQPAHLQPQQPGAAPNGANAGVPLAEVITATTEQNQPKIESSIAGAPRLDAAIAQQATPETSNPVVRQVATNLQTLVRGDLERIRFDLHPEDLGRVSVQMQKVGGVAKVIIVAETAQAFEALQRGASGLQQSLSQSGFDPDEMIFEQRGEDRREREAAEERRERQGDSAQDEQNDERNLAVIRPMGEDDRGLFL